MSTEAKNSYPLERRIGEIDRLRAQHSALVPDTEILLDRIGVGAGWACLDLGCGPGGITAELSARVGATGHVLGLDADPVFVAHAQRHAPGNVKVLEGDAYQTGLPPGGFDLVHVRFVAGTAGRPELLFAEAIRCARPGGVVAFQEPDQTSTDCLPPHPAFARLKGALVAAFAAAGADINLARRLFQLAREAGLQSVLYRPVLLGFCSKDVMTEYLPMTVESLRDTILRHGILTAEDLDASLAACRAHVRDPGTVTTMFTVAQVWGFAPGAQPSGPRL